MITYDASFQKHGIVREFINKFNRKLIILKWHKYANLDTIIILTLLAWIKGPGNTLLARVALQNVRDVLRCDNQHQLTIGCTHPGQ